MGPPQGFEGHEGVSWLKIEDVPQEFNWWIKFDPIWFFSDESRRNHMKKGAIRASLGILVLASEGFDLLVQDDGL